MLSTLKPSLVTASVISLLFSLVSFGWTTLMSGRKGTLAVKQQMSFTLVAIDIVYLIACLADFSEVGCQFLTATLAYLMTVSFVTTFLDHYNNYLAICKRKASFGFMKTLCAGLALPLISIPITIASGLLSSQRTQMFRFPCWNSSAIAWFHTGIAITFVMASFVLFVITYRSAKRKLLVSSERKDVRKFRTSRYSVLVSMTMTSLTSLAWLSAMLVLWNPGRRGFQLTFSLSIGLQGVLSFFLYCIFALEAGIYDDKFPRIRSGADKTSLAANKKSTQHWLSSDSQDEEKSQTSVNEDNETTWQDHNGSHANYGIDSQSTLENLAAGLAEKEDEFSQTIRSTKDDRKFSTIPGNEKDSKDEPQFCTLSGIESPKEELSAEVKPSVSPQAESNKRGSHKRPAAASNKKPQMNLNELEALFSNPEMVAEYTRQRNHSDISASTVTVQMMPWGSSTDVA